MKIYNTLTKKIEKLEELEKNKIKMYVCGPTVYDFIHIGNARSIVVYDLLYRILCYQYSEENVVYVRNITDVDDKIINRASEEKKLAKEISEENIKKFLDDANYLGCKEPNYQPKVTETIPEIIDMIKTLIDKGFAYEIDSGVYFETSKYSDYYALSGRNFDELMSSVRIESNSEKKSLTDFALWKKREVGEEDCLFQSPWGLGRPGWHIECSAMSKKYLGNDFDIHGGGIDLIFPHHTNEIAQSVCANKNSIYAKYWVHNGLLTVDGEKMSKSLGNFITIKDLRDNKIHGEVLRYLLLSVNYRSPLDFNEKAIHDAKENLDYLYRTIYNLGKDWVLSKQESSLSDSGNPIISEEFIGYLYDDMNTSCAIAYILTLAKEINAEKNQKIKIDLAKKLKSCCDLLGLLNENPEFWCGKGGSELHFAVLSGNIDAISKILEKQNDEREENAKKEKNQNLGKQNNSNYINSLDKAGLTPLHYAKILDRNDIVEILLQNGAEENFGNNAFAQRIIEKINTRRIARKDKDFEISDRIRDELLSLGVIIDDIRDGSIDWRYKN